MQRGWNPVGGFSDPRPLPSNSSSSSSSPPPSSYGEDPTYTPSPSFGRNSNRSTNSFTLQRYPSRLHDRTPVLHSRVIKLRVEDQYLTEFLSMEVIDHYPSFIETLSTANNDSRSNIPSPLGMRSGTVR